MTPTTIMVLCLAAVIAVIIAPVIFSRRKDASRGEFPPFRPNPYPTDSAPALDRMRDRMTVGFKEPDMEKRHAARRFPNARRDFGSRPPVRKPAVFLTPHQLTRINRERMARGYRPLNREGFKAATARASMYDRQPDTSTDWITYFILYEMLSGSMTQSSAQCNVGLTIQPDAPFNGHDGEYGGAGASGNWQDTSPVTTSLAAGIADMPPVDPYAVVAASIASPDTSSYTPPQASEPAYSAPDPTPSYSAPDPSPSYSSSDSGSSGGGDSGGGGGGGD